MVERAIGPSRTAETYRSNWRLAVTRLGDRPIDELAPTSKLERRTILAKYADQIEALYT